MPLSDQPTDAVWETLLGPLSLAAGEFLLYLDPDELDAPTSSTGETLRIANRWDLRRAIEQRFRCFDALHTPLLVHVCLPDVRQSTDLPFDARGFPMRVLDVRLPESARADVRNLPPPAVDQLVGRGSLPDRLSSMARELSGLAWPPTEDTALVAVIRLVPHLGPGLRRLVAQGCPPGPARAVLESQEPNAVLERLVGEWLADGSRHEQDHALRAAAEDLGVLIETKQLSVPAGPLPLSLPKVLLQAVHTVDALPEVRRLLEDLPDPGTTFDSWSEFGNAWARCRWRLAAQPPTPDVSEFASEVWKCWADYNDRWQAWLRDNYGPLLTRNVLRLASVHRVAPFLSAHVVEAGAKLLLIVLDGLGVPQWQQVVEHLQVSPAEDRRVLACLPTMTNVSRQAIFAGALPTAFARTIDRPTEEAHWRTFWRDEGLQDDEVFYRRTAGQDSAAWQDPPATAVVCGVAVNAIDDLMHGVSVNGDHQFHAGVTTWLAGGFLERALEWAARVSAQVWVTADHGNLPCTGVGESVPDEGVRVLGRGLRARVYATEPERDDSPLPGLRWTPPGFPISTGAPLFAPGRSYFHKTGSVITHGGLSLDEVLVPLARLV